MQVRHASQEVSLIESMDTEGCTDLKHGLEWLARLQEQNQSRLLRA